MRVDDRNKSSEFVLRGYEVITVTNRTVRFSKTVCQTKNISSFSEGHVERGLIPWVMIILSAIAGFFLFSISRYTGDGSSGLASILILFAFAGGLWNIGKPKHYGFLLSLNSGDRKLFVTQDTAGIKQVISTIYDFIEDEQDATYQISISNSQIKGNFVQGHVSGDIGYR
jgi:hypothetical protein